MCRINRAGGRSKAGSVGAALYEHKCDTPSRLGQLEAASSGGAGGRNAPGGRAQSD